MDLDGNYGVAGLICCGGVQIGLHGASWEVGTWAGEFGVFNLMEGWDGIGGLGVVE